MNKTEARTCFGCKANCSKGCAFGFTVRKLKIGDGTGQRIHKFPVEPCFKVKTEAQFMRVAERMEGQERLSVA